jgi:copper chaperone CopZ
MTEHPVIATRVAVAGMTCEHCVASVTEELGAVSGVQAVDVTLNPGGTSQVVVTSEGTLDPAALGAAIAEAGYAVAEA